MCKTSAAAANLGNKSNAPKLHATNNGAHIRVQVVHYEGSSVAETVGVGA